MSSSNSIRDQSSEISQSTGLKRFRCTVPGCAKVFVRREHLTRHLKSHGSNPEYACHICERKFARSDVLKRHVDFHPQYAKTKRTPVACKSCHDTKLRCDGNTPCGSCIRKSIHCIRAGNDGGSDITRQTLDHESSCGSTVMEDVSKAQSDSDPVLSNNDGPHWFQSSQGNWSLQPLPIGGNTSFPGNTPADGLKNWAVEAGGHTGSSLLLNTPIEAPSLAPDLITLQQSAFPSTTEGQGEKFSNTHSSHSESTPPSSVQNQRDHGMNLKHYIKRESATTDRLVALYFMEVHPYWPFLHAPTFNTRDVPDLLFASMAILVSCLEGEHDNPNLTSLVFDQLSIIHMHPDPPLHTLQALLLCVLYCTCHLSTEGMLIRALSFHGILVSVCRCSGVLSGQYGSQNFGHDEIVSWITEEQMHRLAFSVLRIDAYLSLLSDQPPLIRYHELSIPLPKSSQLWAAAADKERRRLQWNEPAGREKALFCFLIRDILDASRQAHLTCHLSEIDYHIGLCAMQSATWEAAREAHISASAELGLRAGPEDLIALRRNDLKVWREIMEEDTQLRQNYFSRSTSDADHLLSPHTLILWHMSALNMHAPLNLLRIRGYYLKSRPSATIPTRNPELQLHSWMASKCSRIAVWNAAQIARIVSRETEHPNSNKRLVLNPLAIPGLLMSAAVVLVYAFYSRVCPVCTGGEPLDLVHLFGAEDDCERLVRWKETGSGLASWGPSLFNGTQVCQCMVDKLANWFRGLLSRDTKAEARLIAFLAELKGAL